MVQRKHKTIISRNELMTLVAYDKETQFPAKIDTGAYHSAIHCTDMKVVKRGDKKVLVGNLLNGHPCAYGKSLHFETTKFNRVEVANSFGQVAKRYEVSLRCKIGHLVYNTSFTLADRSQKLFPILMGRTALSRRFLVDVSYTHIDRRYLKKHFGKSIPEELLRSNTP